MNDHFGGVGVCEVVVFTVNFSGGKNTEDHKNVIPYEKTHFTTHSLHTTIYVHELNKKLIM